MTGAKEENCVCYCHIILAYLDYGIRRCSLYIPMCCVYYLMEQQRAKSNSCRLVKPVSRSGYVHLLAPGLIFRNRSFARLYLYATAALKRLRHATLFPLNKFLSRDKGIGGASSAPLSTGYCRLQGLRPPAILVEGQSSTTIRPLPHSDPSATIFHSMLKSFNNFVELPNYLEQPVPSLLSCSTIENTL